ncbi:MAG: hypothetical protein QXX15_02075, partial [Desulfurococcaceae archaeon]
ELVQEAAAKLGSNALLLQYLDALKSIAQSPATKIVVPMELLTGFSKLITTFVPGQSTTEEKKVEQ